MTTNPASYSDVEDRWRTLSAAEQAQATTYLGDAWAILKNRVPDLEDRLDDATLNPALVVIVEVSMVLRVMKNPDGKKQESIDDYSFTRDGATSTGSMYVDPSELLAIMPLGATTRSKRLVAYEDFA